MLHKPPQCLWVTYIPIPGLHCIKMLHCCNKSQKVTNFYPGDLILRTVFEVYKVDKVCGMALKLQLSKLQNQRWAPPKIHTFKEK